MKANAVMIVLGLLLLWLIGQHSSNVAERERQNLAHQYQFCIHHYGPGPALHSCLAGQNRREK